jgi:outer membrane biosynthesis protein TonB
LVSGELESSLRTEVDAYINSRLSGLQEEIARLQSQVNEAFTRLMEQSRGAALPDAEVASTISEVIRAAHERGVVDAAAESAHTRASSEMAILKAAVDDISEQHSQSEILSMLVNRAASFAPRIAFFVIRNEQAVGWRARGLEGTVGDDAVREIMLPLSADTPLSDVVRSRTTWSGQPGGNAEDYLLLNKLGSDPPQRMVAIPLVARGRAAAVLYADSAALDADAINLEALETLMRVASMAVELTAARPAPAPQPAQAEPAAAEQPQAEQEVAEPPAPTPEAPEPVEAQEAAPAQPVAEAPAVEEEEAAPSFEPTPATEEEVGEVTAVMEAPAPAESFPQTQPATETTAGQPQPGIFTPGQFSAPLGGARSYGRAADAAELPVEVSSDDERRLHNDARRFARLLVSEIKLYNKEKVEEGRQVGDLYERLREDIDRSRQMYDKRVAPPVAARYDYFHQELVNTLAEGDPSKLGSGYPGAAV